MSPLAYLGSLEARLSLLGAPLPFAWGATAVSTSIALIFAAKDERDGEQWCSLKRKRHRYRRRLSTRVRTAESAAFPVSGRPRVLAVRPHSDQTTLAGERGCLARSDPPPLHPVACSGACVYSVHHALVLTIHQEDTMEIVTNP